MEPDRKAPHATHAVRRPASAAVQRSAPVAQPPAHVVQQRLGNVGAQRYVAGLQRKPTVSAPADSLERQADIAAGRVMRTSEQGLVQRACRECEEEKQTTVPPVVHEVLRSPGEPLDSHDRVFFESRFGHDFSGVRVHTGSSAAVSARSVGALAYTVGRDIVFGDGQSASNRPLLAHELAHVIQQTAAPPVLQRFASCRHLLVPPEVTPVAEKRVQDSLVRDANRLGTVERELAVPGGSATPWRTEPAPGRSDKVIKPQILSELFDRYGRVDIAVLNGTTLEVIEVKEASFPSAVFAESQLDNYIEKGNRAIGRLQRIWRARGHPHDKITSVRAMPTDRLDLTPAVRSIAGTPVSLAWCRDGIIVFKALGRPPVPVRVPERARAHSPARVRVSGYHPFFVDYANRLPYLEAPAGREFIVTIEAGLFAQQVSEAQRQMNRSMTRGMRIDPRGVPFIQVEPVLIGGAVAAAVVGGAILLVTLAPAIPVLVGAVVAAAASVPAVTSSVNWTAGRLTVAAAAGVIAFLIDGGMSKAEASEAVKPLIGERIIAVADVTTRPDLANAKPGEEISVDGKRFRAIIRLTTRE